jgi:putative ABC transport system permease protein
MFRRRRKSSDFSTEIETHIALETERLQEHGLSYEQALTEARRAFGNITRAQERNYESGRWMWWDHLRLDVRYCFRTLRKAPGLTLVAVLTLALGIGANTAIFSIVNAVLLAPLPFPDPDRLVVLHAVDNGRTVAGPSPADLVDYARSNHTLEELAGYDYWRKNVSGIGGTQQAEEMFVGLVPSAYFDALRIRPLLGRLFRDEENEYGKHYVAVISSTFWRERYGSDQHVLGQTLRINDEPYTIIGVIPDVIPLWMNAWVGGKPQIWTPMAPYANYFAEASRGNRGLYTLARLKPGVTMQEAETDLNLVAAQLAQRYPVDKGVGVKLVPLADLRVGPLRPVLLLLTGAVGLILLIACSNVANLLLVRHSGRRREFALRAALGGPRKAIIRQLLVESFTLALLGGALGVLLASLGGRLVLALRPQQFLQLSETRLDMRVLLFSAALSLLTLVVAGLAPAFTAARVNLADALKDAGRTSSADAGRQRVRRWLVIAETGLSLMLMIAAGLLLQTILHLQHQELGFAPTHLLRGHLYAPPARYPDSPSLTHFVDGLRERVAAIPGVRDAAITTLFPPNNRWNQVCIVPGQPAPRTGELPLINFGVTDEHFLPTFGVPLLHGRNFTAADTETSMPVALINQAAARSFFPSDDPVGRTVHLGMPGHTPIPGSSELSADLMIIGVIGDTRNQGLRQPAAPQLIALYRQLPAVNFGFKDIVVRTAQEPLSVTSAIRDQLHGLDPDIPFAEVTTIEDIVARQTSDTRFTTVLLGLFAALGTVLAMIGVYGVISYAMAQRTQEIGIRIALGAQSAHVLWLALRPGIVIGALGAVLGGVGAAAARTVLSTLLFGISPLDPLTFAAAAGLLLCAVVAACAVPARRASRVDPIVALRCE